MCVRGEAGGLVCSMRVHVVLPFKFLTMIVIIAIIVVDGHVLVVLGTSFVVVSPTWQLGLGRSVGSAYFVMK